MYIKRRSYWTVWFGRAIDRSRGFSLLTYTFVFLQFSCQEKNQHHINRGEVPLTTVKSTPSILSKTNIDGLGTKPTIDVGSTILSIFQDKSQRYWIGTQSSGLYVYDGQNVKRYTIKDGLYQNQVQHIQQNDLGHIWIGTGGFGLNYVEDTAIQSLGFIQGSVKDWMIKPGDLWFPAGGGVYRYFNKSLTYLPFPKPHFIKKYTPLPASRLSAYSVYSVIKTRQGHLWLGTQAMGVCRFDGKSFTWFTEKGLRGSAVLAIFEDQKGHLWFGTNGNGVYRFDGQHLINFTEENGLSNPEFVKSGKPGPGTLARVWAINENQLGHLWFGTGDAGVWRYDERSLTNYTFKNGLPNHPIECIYKDLNNELWFGTNGGGIYKFNGVAFTKFRF